MNKKRIAFCFSWQARTLDFTYQYFETKVFKPAKEQWFEYDIFCAVEDDKDYWKVEKFLKPIKIKKIKSPEIAKDIEKKYWKFIRINQGKKFFYYNSVRYPIVNWLQQWYKIYESNKLKLEYEKEQWFEYDIVVRLRFDTVFINKLNFNKILEDIKNWIVLNKEEWWLNVLSDYFAFWSSNNMNNYSNLYYNFKEILWRKDNIKFTQRLILLFYLSILNILFLIQKYVNQYIKNKIEQLILIIVILFIDKKITYVFIHERYMYENIKYYNINILFSSISYTICRWRLNFYWNKIHDITKYEFF